MVDTPSGPADADRPLVQGWPPQEDDVAAAEALLVQLPALVAEIEQTLSQAKLHLGALSNDAPLLREVLKGVDYEKDRFRLADLKAAQSLRAELVKAAQQSVTVSQAAAKYLQARERFLQARRAWTMRQDQ